MNIPAILHYMYGVAGTVMYPYVCVTVSVSLLACCDMCCMIWFLDTKYKVICSRTLFIVAPMKHKTALESAPNRW